MIIIVNEMESIIRQARGTDVLAELAELAELEPRYEMSSLLIFSTGAVLCSNLTTAGDKIPSPARRKQAQLVLWLRKGLFFVESFGVPLGFFWSVFFLGGGVLLFFVGVLWLFFGSSFLGIEEP